MHETGYTNQGARSDWLLAPDLFLDCFSATGHLSEGRELIVGLHDVGVEDVAVVLCHFERAVSHELLECECVATAIDQEFASERVTEHVQAGLLDAAVLVVSGDGQPQTVLRQKLAELITEEIVGTRSAANGHIVAKNSCHRRAKRYHLHFATLCVPERDLTVGEIYVFNLDVSHRRRTTTAIDQKVHDCPVAVFAEIAIRFRHFQKESQLLIGVGFFYRLRCFEDRNGDRGITLSMTPREEYSQRSCVTVYRSVGKMFRSH